MNPIFQANPFLSLWMSGASTWMALLQRQQEAMLRFWTGALMPAAIAARVPTPPGPDPALLSGGAAPPVEALETLRRQAEEAARTLGIPALAAEPPLPALTVPPAAEESPAGEAQAEEEGKAAEAAARDEGGEGPGAASRGPRKPSAAPLRAGDRVRGGPKKAPGPQGGGEARGAPSPRRPKRPDR